MESGRVKRLGKKERIFLRSLGVFFILLGIGAMLTSSWYGNQGSILWFCYIGLSMIGIGLISLNSNIVFVQLNIMLIPLIGWDIDFLAMLFTNTSPLGFTGYFFEGHPLLLRAISLQHFYTLPLVFFALYIMGNKRKDLWKWSALEMAGIFLLSRVFTEPANNVNCAFRSCVDIGFSLPYPVTWFIVAFIMVVITNFAITRWLGRLNK